ncbi:conjugal transfer protein TraD [Methylobacterium indicum]|jgi:Conjugal transfer protein TraD|uniref:Conjugal transfer protein TraD n=2 Tax=Methylobacterium TaxID=407 RepID=A0ABR5HIN1_9HYPH|nr:conjugal transfer protein TraD [Methylobacterium indicum]KMO22434.1 conjugal transfer protein TraD [Methylobacterium indicum]KMO26541.1 conjugal transfer protein TraD [Methylobacterium indicum]
MLKRNEERKRDAREKIQLGGLVIKAGLSDLPSNVLLGLLIEARERIRDPDVIERMARLGDKEFKK